MNKTCIKKHEVKKSGFIEIKNFVGHLVEGNIEVIQLYYNDSDLDDIGELYCKTFLEKG